jgi:hypothetical protein
MNTEKKKIPIIVIGDCHANHTSIAECLEKLDFTVKVIGSRETSEEEVRKLINPWRDGDICETMTFTNRGIYNPPPISNHNNQHWRRKNKKHYF